MTSQEALSYASSTVLGGQIEAAQTLYRQASSEGAPPQFLTPLLSIIENLADLDRQLIAYDQEVGRKFTALQRTGTGMGAVPGNGGPSVSPMAATAIGLGSVALGGILGFAAAKMGSKPKSEDEEEEAT